MWYVDANQSNTRDFTNFTDEPLHAVDDETGHSLAELTRLARPDIASYPKRCNELPSRPTYDRLEERGPR